MSAILPNVRFDTAPAMRYPDIRGHVRVLVLIIGRYYGMIMSGPPQAESAVSRLEPLHGGTPSGRRGAPSARVRIGAYVVFETLCRPMVGSCLAVRLPRGSG